MTGCAARRRNWCGLPAVVAPAPFARRRPWPACIPEHPCYSDLNPRECAGVGRMGISEAATRCLIVRHRRGLGWEVTVLEMAASVMSRAPAPNLAAFYESSSALHCVRNPLQIRRCGALHGDPQRPRARVLTDAWPRLTADIVISVCGAVPADELARAAGPGAKTGW